MARVRIPFSIETKTEVKPVSGSNINAVEPVVGATISGTNRVTSAAAKFYSSESSETPVASPVTDGNGNIPYWVEEGAWTITVEGGSPSISPATYAFDALSGRGTVKLAGSAVTSATVASEAITTEKIAKNAITTSKFAEGSVTSAQIAAGGIKTTNIENAAITLPKMAGPYFSALAPVLTPHTGGDVISNNMSFTAHGGHCYAFFNCSGYAAEVGSYAFYLDLDAVYTNYQSFMYINQPQVHISFPTIMASLGVLSGPHVLRLRSSATLHNDTNDTANVAVLELP